MGRESGSATTEFALLFPVVLVLLLGGPQLGMWYFARQAAEAAAQTGARAASTAGAPEHAGSTAAEDYLATVGTGTMTSHSVLESRDAATVTITVRAEVPRVVPLPGFDPAVTATVVRLRERFTGGDVP